MKIGFDATPLIHSVGGIARYAKNLLQALLELQSGDQFIGYIPAGTFSQLPWPPDKYPEGLKWVEVNRLSWRRRGASDELDVYHGTNFKLQTSGCRGSALTIHDLWLDRHPEHSKKLFGQHLSFLRTKRRVHKASRVIAVSEFTSNEIQELYEVPAKKISVVYHGISKEFFPDPGPNQNFGVFRERFGIPDKPYVLFLGGANPRKNHDTLFKAFAKNSILHQQYSLVVVGTQSFRGYSLEQAIQRVGLKQCVVCIDQVSLDELRVLYSRAEMFVFPSRYEGFGFPVLEAMACGVPVVTSKCSAMVEVAGDAALLVDPEHSEGLGQAMGQILQDSALQDTLRQKGITRAASFDWRRTAEQTLQVYRTMDSIK